MLSKDPNPFIDVRDRVPDYDSPQGISTASTKKMKMRGPELRLHNVKLNISEEDFSKTMKAEIKFIPRMIRSEQVDGKSKQTYEIEVVGIRII